MPIKIEQLNAFEQLIAEGKTQEVLDGLLQLKASTAYKAEILVLNGQWKNLNSQQLMGAIADEDYRIALGKLNVRSLTLISRLKREKVGEKKAPVEGLEVPGQKPFFSIIRPHIPWILSALVTGFVVWMITSLNYERVCDDGGANLNGAWYIKWRGTDHKRSLAYGRASIVQDSCFRNFAVSGEFEAKPGGLESPMSFSSKIGGYSDREVFFIYENSNRERGTCHGVLLNQYKDKFELLCSDLATAGDTSNGTTGIIIFSSTPFDRSVEPESKDTSTNLQK